jgi:hypothetical protein
MIANSPKRLTKRRKEALIRREANLKVWKSEQSGTLIPTAQIEHAQRKMAIAETDIANLQKKVGTFG